MDRQQANEESKRSNPGSRSLRCIWYCGKINEEIRKAVKLQFGAGSVKEVPRCDYEIALEQVRTWDDYKAMKAIREKARA